MYRLFIVSLLPMCSLFAPRNTWEFLGANREHIGSKETVKSLYITREETVTRSRIESKTAGTHKDRDKFAVLADFCNQPAHIQNRLGADSSGALGRALGPAIDASSGPEGRRLPLNQLPGLADVHGFGVGLADAQAQGVAAVQDGVSEVELAGLV